MKRPPRLVVRTLAAAFVTVAVIRSVVFIVLMVDALAAVLPQVALDADPAAHELLGQPVV